MYVIYFSFAFAGFRMSILVELLHPVLVISVCIACKQAHRSHTQATTRESANEAIHRKEPGVEALQTCNKRKPVCRLLYCVYQDIATIPFTIVIIVILKNIDIIIAVVIITLTTRNSVPCFYNSVVIKITFCNSNKLLLTFPFGRLHNIVFVILYIYLSQRTKSSSHS